VAFLKLAHSGPPVSAAAQGSKAVAIKIEMVFFLGIDVDLIKMELFKQ